MRKVIVAINMTLDGFCDHTAVIADEEIHQHYADLLANAGVVLYGRKTYQLVEYWRTVLHNPFGNKATDEFAAMMDRIPKIVFSNTLNTVDWKSATLAHRTLSEEVVELKNQPGQDIFIGSRSVMLQLMKLHLIDEYQICIHPVIVGSGLPLFDNISDRTLLTLIRTKTFNGGAVTLYYESTPVEAFP